MRESSQLLGLEENGYGSPSSSAESLPVRAPRGADASGRFGSLRRVMTGAVALSAVLGAAAVWSTRKAASGAGAGLALEEEPTYVYDMETDDSMATFSFEGAEMNVGVHSDEADSTTEHITHISITSKGVPSAFVEKGNKIVVALATNSIMGISVSSETTDFTLDLEALGSEDLDGEGPMMPTLADFSGMPDPVEAVPSNTPEDPDIDKTPPGPEQRRRLDLPQNHLPSMAGSLMTRAAFSQANCTQSSADDETASYSYECHIPHAPSTEYANAVKLIYQGVFQIYKEVFEQNTGLVDRSGSQLIKGEWEAIIDSTAVSLLVQPTVDGTGLTMLASLDGGYGLGLKNGLANLFSDLSELTDPSAALNDTCVDKYIARKYHLTCQHDIYSTMGIVGAINVLAEGLMHAI